MIDYKQQFIQFAIDNHALSFGSFTLKSGRVSPYFFNAGVFNRGSTLRQLGQFYAQAIYSAQLRFDMFFGPAYKGIPLVTSVAMAMAELYTKDYPYSFNRKEAKDHGEGGMIVGKPLQGRVLIIDDVITAGTAIRSIMPHLTQANATPAGIFIMLDRQEKGQGKLSAIQEIEKQYQIPVISIIQLADLIRYLAKQPKLRSTLADIEAYQAHYGV